MKNEKTLFGDFTTLRWVKWNKRKPNWNGSVIIRWNDKFTSFGLVWDGKLLKLDNDETKHETINGRMVVQYTAKQKQILKDAYWLEETHDLKGFDDYRRGVEWVVI